MLYPRRVSSEQRAAAEQIRVEYSEELRDIEALRPQTRADCHRVRLSLVAELPDGDPYKVHAPCPFVSCRYHLHADVDERGVITLVEGDIAHTCALDVIDRHPDGLSREEMATVLRVSEERTRIAERRLARILRADGSLNDWADHDSSKSSVWDDAA